MGVKDKFSSVKSAFGALKALGRDPTRLSFDAILSPTEAMLEGRPTILLGTNNYLGLTFDPACQEAGARAAELFGVGTTGSRIANGTYGPHRALEERIARFYGKRGAIVFSTGYLANLGVITAIAGPGDRLLIDADSHASIYDACRMSGAEVIRFRHNSPEDLARRLARLGDQAGDRIIVTEGVYSMLGDAAPLAEIAAVRREAGEGAYLVVDEAHSLGVLGANGRGLAERDGVEADCDFIVGTFSKSVGAIGGFCVSDLEDFELLRNISRPYMFTASPSPAAIAAAHAAFDQIAARPELRQRLWRNARLLHGGLGALGFETGPEPSPVVAVKLATRELAVVLWNRLIEAGVYTNIALPPATPNGLSLLRCSVSAAHDDAQIERALETFEAVGREICVIAPKPRRRAPRPAPVEAPARLSAGAAPATAAARRMA